MLIEDIINAIESVDSNIEKYKLQINKLKKQKRQFQRILEMMKDNELDSIMSGVCDED